MSDETMTEAIDRLGELGIDVDEVGEDLDWLFDGSGSDN
jgi:hypothetical protein